MSLRTEAGLNPSSRDEDPFTYFFLAIMNKGRGVGAAGVMAWGCD